MAGRGDLEIRLNDEDQSQFSINRFMVVGKILADRTLNRGGVIRLLKGIWQDEVRCVRQLCDNVYAVSFDSAEGRRKAVYDGPWNIMGFPVHFQIWSGDLMVEEIDFSFLHIWIQIHNLPVYWLSKGNAEVIGSRLGRIIKIDDRFVQNGVARNFMRMRIEIDTRLPLVEGFWVPRRDNGRLWAQVRYEKLPDFCYRCGMMGHINRGCKSRVEVHGEGSSRARYGVFMRVPALRGGRDEEMCGVEGFAAALRIAENDLLLSVRRKVDRDDGFQEVHSEVRSEGISEVSDMVGLEKMPVGNEFNDGVVDDGGADGSVSKANAISMVGAVSSIGESMVGGSVPVLKDDAVALANELSSILKTGMKGKDFLDPKSSASEFYDGSNKAVVEIKKTSDVVKKSMNCSVDISKNSGEKDSVAGVGMVKENVCNYFVELPEEEEDKDKVLACNNQVADLRVVRELVLPEAFRRLDLKRGLMEGREGPDECSVVVKKRRVLSEIKVDNNMPNVVKKVEGSCKDVGFCKGRGGNRNLGNKKNGGRVGRGRPRKVVEAGLVDVPIEVVDYGLVDAEKGCGGWPKTATGSS